MIKTSVTVNQLKRAVAIKEQIDGLNKELRSIFSGSSNLELPQRKTRARVLLRQGTSPANRRRVRSSPLLRQRRGYLARHTAAAVCSLCGAALKSTKGFCSNCGQPIVIAGCRKCATLHFAALAKSPACRPAAVTPITTIQQEK